MDGSAGMTFLGALGAFVVILLPGPVSAADVVARVDGHPITRGEVNEVVRSVLAGREALPSGEEVRKLIDDALDSLIEQELLYGEAERRGLEVDESAVEQAVVSNRARFASADDFRRALAASNMDIEKLHAETRRILVVDRLIEQEMGDLTIREEEVRAFYDKHAASLQGPPEIRLRQILVRLPSDADAAERELARERVRRLQGWARVRDFADLAREYSDDAQTAARGGDMGFFTVEQLPESFVDAVEGLESGGISDSVQSTEGYHILQVAERRRGSAPSFATVRDDIESLLRDDKRRKHRAELVARLREKAKIEVYPGEGKTEDRRRKTE